MGSEKEVTAPEARGPDARYVALVLADLVLVAPDGFSRVMLVDVVRKLAAALRAHPAGERDTSHRLAMLALQSERYQMDVDYREAVDDVLAWTMPRTPTGGHQR